MNAFPARPPRIDLFQRTRPFYFVTFNTWKRLPILADTRIHDAFVAFCIRAHEEHHVAVGRYVLMPDHIHLFVFLPEDMILSRWVQSLKSILGKSLIYCGHDKPHWQEGFFDHVLRTGESYGEKWAYVLAKPVRAGLCQEPGQWPWQGEIMRIEF